MAQADLQTNEEICDFARLGSPDGAVVAIDAPLVVRNTGQCRPVERQLTEMFWPCDAAPYPANLSNPAFQEVGQHSNIGESVGGFRLRAAARDRSTAGAAEFCRGLS